MGGGHPALPGARHGAPARLARERRALLLAPDAWAPETPRDTQPHLDISLALQLGGDIVAPTIFSYNGSVGYTRSTSSANGAEMGADGRLVYDLGVRVLNHDTSPLK